MVNDTLLEKKITDSGLKIDFIVDILGITRQAFYKKRKGIAPFRGAEVYALSDLLKISSEEKEAIFFASEVNL